MYEQRIEAENDRNTKDYYHELHEAARHYNTKLWTIPGLFIIIVGFIFDQLADKDNIGNNTFSDLDSFVSLENFILLAGGILCTLLLMIQFSKDSFLQISIQKKINELEDKSGLGGMPLYSLTDTQMLKRLAELAHNKNDPAFFNCVRECLFRRRFSSYFIALMILFLFLMTIGILIIGISFIY